ncbi:hypothetical protein [Candidatus Kuenenia stuttgartiensis]|uniref:hypothetical protein n=1 Tax=Kuenenia stuttgartiensis TaxID=174633 RepID=UPI001469D2F5|nr:hypothetical protein [Candidatus Kuenenia stuttgartiensis]
MIYLNGELSTYTENNKETVQFETGIHYQIAELFDATVFTGREDVLENFITLSNHRARYYTGGGLCGILINVLTYMRRGNSTGIMTGTMALSMTCLLGINFLYIRGF